MALASLQKRGELLPMEETDFKIFSYVVVLVFISSRQPRRGNAGRSTVEANIKPVTDDQEWFGTFRLGIWPNYFDGVQFDKSEETLNQFLRQMTPNIGPIDTEVITSSISELFNKIERGY